MSERSIRAKLSVVRALSTVLMAVALAHRAGAQVFDEPSRYAGSSWWVGVGSGQSERISISDKASEGKWFLEPSTPVRVQVAWGRAARTVGLTVSNASIPLNIIGPSYAGCRARVRSTQALGTYRSTAPITTSRFRSVLEFGGGITRWSGLRGRNGCQVPVVAANIDFTFAASIGIALPVSEYLEVSVSYDIAALVHEKEQHAYAVPGATAKVSVPTLLAGARLRLAR